MFVLRWKNTFEKTIVGSVLAILVLSILWALTELRSGRLQKFGSADSSPSVENSVSTPSSIDYDTDEFFEKTLVRYKREHPEDWEDVLKTDLQQSRNHLGESRYRMRFGNRFNEYEPTPSPDPFPDPFPEDKTKLPASHPPRTQPHPGEPANATLPVTSP